MNASRHSTVPSLSGLLLFLLWAAASGHALGQTGSVWVNPSVGNWSVASNWYPNVPNSGSLAFINNGGLVLLNSPGAAANFLYLGEYSGDSGFMDVSGPGNL